MRLFILILTLLTLTPHGRGEALAQVRIAGSLSRAALVEVEIGAMVGGQARVVEVEVFLSRHTTGADLLSLVASRLESSGFHSHLGPAGQATLQGRTLFVEDALFVNLALYGGLRGTITCCKGLPRALQVTSAPGRNGLVEIEAGLFNPATRQHTTTQLTVQIDEGMHSAETAQRLMKVAEGEKWASERPTATSWRPIRPGNGQSFTGFSISCQDTLVELQVASVPE